VYGAKKELYTPEDWSDPETATSNGYSSAKTKAEKFAWDFVANLPENEKIELATILPCFIYGPAINN
jgi:dihydroflavonol-4-reductase